MSGEKKGHPTNALGVPILPAHSPEDSATPAPLPGLWSLDGGTRLDVTAGFSTTNKLISRIIRFITRGKVSHAWTAFHDAVLDTRLVMQAEWWGFELRPWARWAQENRLVAEFQLLVPPDVQLAAVRKMRDHLGEKYDKIGALWAGLAAWLRRWWQARLTLRPRRTPRKLMCAEAQLVLLKAAGICAVAECYEETVDPQTLMERLEQSDQVVRVYPK